MNRLWKKFRKMSQECYNDAILEPKSLLVWMNAYQALKKALLAEWKENASFPREYEEIDDSLDYTCDVVGWLEDFFDELESQEVWEIVIEKANEVIGWFAWEEIRPDEFQLRIATALMEQEKYEEAERYCANWYAEDEDNVAATTALVYAWISTGKFAKAESLVNKFIQKDTVCDDENGILFLAAEMLYQAQGKHKKAKDFREKMDAYDAKISLEMAEFDQAYDFFVEDDEDLPF